MICQKTIPINKSGAKKGGIDLNEEYHFRHASGNPTPGETSAQH